MNHKITVLATAYAMNPFKGSEDGMGWNFALQIARFQNVILLTRKNNREHIEKYMKEHPSSLYASMSFVYFDLPYWMRFWKKGERGALVYYFFWQLFLIAKVKSSNLRFDIVHNLNFHNDWTPSFLWLLRKPKVWGPIGHHPKIPKAFVLPIYGMKTYIQDRLKWMVKCYAWKISPLLWLTKLNSDVILTMNSSVKDKIYNIGEKEIRMPSVASDSMAASTSTSTKAEFHVLSVGRFVPLKGFDITIKAFAKFYNGVVNGRSSKRPHLTLVGKGPEEPKLRKLISEMQLEDAITIISWVKREELKQIYSNSHVFLFPSHEGAGMVVAEAMSAGLPILCFDNYGPGEFVTSDVGVKVPYSQYHRCINQFSTSLNCLYRNRWELERYSKSSKALFTQNFEWNVRGELLSSVYQSLFRSEVPQPIV